MKAAALTAVLVVFASLAHAQNAPGTPGTPGSATPTNQTTPSAAIEPRADVAIAQRPLRISGAVAARLLKHRVDPEYPPAALQAHVQGTVVLAGQIDAAGHVTSAEPVSGPSMLREAARNAVLQWTYEPYVLNGVAKPVQTPITVTFEIPEN